MIIKSFLKKVISIFAGFIFTCALVSCQSKENEVNWVDGEYSGEIQSYLEVYRDVWNASTPEDLHFDEVVGYDEPVSYRSYQENGGFAYAQIGEKGTVYDSRTLNVRWSYGFEADFTNSEAVPHPYFAGKVVNGVYILATVSYTDTSKYGKYLSDDIGIIILQKDGRIFEAERNIEYELPEHDPDFSGVSDEYFADYDNANAFNRFFADNNEALIGLSYYKPFYGDFIITRGDDYYYAGYHSFRAATGKQDGKYVYGSKWSGRAGSYITLSNYGRGGTVQIDPPYELVKNNLTKFEAKYIGIEEGENYSGGQLIRYYYKINGQKIVWFNRQESPSNICGIQITASSRYESKSKMKNITFYSISYGPKWRPSLYISFTACNCFCSWEVSSEETTTSSAGTGTVLTF